MRRLHGLFFLIVFPAAVALGAQAAGPSLSLSQCVEQALAAGPDGIMLGRNLDLARTQYRLGESQRGFSISATVGESANQGFGDANLLAENSLSSDFAQTPQAGLSLGSPMTSLSLNSSPYIASSPLGSITAALMHLPAPGPSGSLGLGFSQVLWNGYPGGAARAASRKGLLALRSQELSGEAGRSSIVTAVSQSYFIMLGAQLDLAAKVEIRAQQDSLFDQITSLFDLGLANEVDKRSAEINARSARIEEKNAGNALGTARARLAQLLGRARDSSFAVAEEGDPSVPVASLEEAVAAALSRRVEFRQIEISRQAAAIDRDLIRGQRSPSLSVNGGLNLIYQWQAAPVAGQGSIGAKLSMPILDSGASAHQLEANAIQNEEFGLQEGQLRAKIATDVEESYNLAQVQLARLETARLAAERSQLRLKLRRTEVSFGTAKNQDLLDAAVEYADARSAVTNAHRNAHLAIVQLRDLMGYQEKLHE